MLRVAGILLHLGMHTAALAMLESGCMLSAQRERQVSACSNPLCLFYAGSELQEWLQGCNVISPRDKHKPRRKELLCLVGKDAVQMRAGSSCSCRRRL